ncbi:MAG: tRNA (adenosine(37)-N6)-threonylcarbamoyltransferase complex transferase subunit TsaD [Verrucomicrobia bacterium]|nr:tRNA (adenosine(37)-N6)-threonylcarbamoyltransferase complex transferase subunit TsaD [Verrucomicrobiota bacterium]
MNILGVETSCDETSAAVVRDGVEILSNVVSSQVEIHRPYGGVVPELASRQHLELIQPVIEQALERSGCALSDIDAVAATYGPGLASSLLIGLNAAKGVAFALKKPFLGINHLEAHLYSPLLSVHNFDALPMISIIVSGGHTILAHVTAIGSHEILGQTVDDAAGEAFDKVAKLLGLRYPGGPEVDRLAKEGNRAAIPFPRSMLDDPGFNFSFSGLKTSVLYYLKKNPDAVVADVCASFQEAVVDVLVGKTLRAARHAGVRAISASGGVSINSRFRERLAAECQRGNLRLFLASAPLCTDNAAMIASLAFHKLHCGTASDWSLDVAPSIGLGRA